jgi:hypothetical protein
MRGGLTANVDNTVLVADEVFALASFKTGLENFVESLGLFLVSLDTVRDLLWGVSAEGQGLVWVKKRSMMLTRNGLPVPAWVRHLITQYLT